MAKGIGFVCPSCRETVAATLGAGYSYASVCRQAIQEMHYGAHGPEFQRIVREEPVIAVDAEQKLFVCEDCGRWTNGPDLTLYRPDGKTKNPRLNLQPDDGVIIAYSKDLKTGFERIRTYPHLCPGCGREMRSMQVHEINRILCPACGGELQLDLAAVRRVH